MTRRTVTVSGKDVTFQSSAAIPRLYRIRFRRDIFQDLSALEKSFNTKGEKGALEIGDLEVFENITYIMAKHADPTIPDDISEWLEDFEMFSIYEILPEILEMWNINMQTDVAPKKK